MTRLNVLLLPIGITDVAGNYTFKCTTVSWVIANVCPFLYSLETQNTNHEDSHGNILKESDNTIFKRTRGLFLLF